MSVQPLLKDLDPSEKPVLSDPILVTVTIDPLASEIVTISPDPVRVPWLFAGDIVFTIEGEDTFQDPGITFTEPLPAPFIISLTDDKHCVVSALNDDPEKTVKIIGPYHYRVNLQSGTVHFWLDPTVENDSPPPPDGH